MKSLLSFGKLKKTDTENQDVTQEFFPFSSEGLTELYSSTRRFVVGCFIAFGLLFISVMFVIAHLQNNAVIHLSINQDKQTQIILNQLSDVSIQLQRLSSSSQNLKSFKTALININQNLNSINKNINKLAKADDVQKMTLQITTMKQDMDSEVLDLKRAIANGADSKTYLDSKVLPFKILSVDVISEQPFISIDYDHHITPLAVGDTVAGWQVVSADYATSQVEFKNNRGQYVKTILQG